MSITNRDMKESYELFNGTNKQYYDDEEGTWHTFDEVLLIGGGVRKWFKGFSKDSLLGFDTASWSKSPARSAVAPFSMTTIDSVEFYSVAQLELTFPIITYLDFIELQKLLHERKIYATFFNVYSAEWITREMTTTGNERGMLHNFGTMIGGVRQVKVKFVATNNNLKEYINEETIYVQYYDSNNSVISTQICGIADQVVIGDNINQYSQWQEIDNGGTYYKGQSVTMFKRLLLKGIDTTDNILGRLVNINSGNIM